MFPKNAWYVAATPNEIDEKPLGRTICNEKIVFWRPRAGEVAALEDFCPHRGDLALAAPVEDDLLVADGAAERLVVDLVGGAGDVPGVLGKHGESWGGRRGG